MIELFKKIRRSILTGLKMRPIHSLIKKLKNVDFLIMDRVLEVFGYTGAYHTLDYIGYVKHLDIWEINEECAPDLKKNLPNATIKITDSYSEIRNTNKTFDTIFIDNHQGIFGGDKCEHFEICRDCFQKLADKSVLITNILPDILNSKYKVNEDVLAEHIEKRKKFYNHSTGTKIELADFEKTYRSLAVEAGFTVKHIFFVRRNYLVTYMALCVEKK